MWKVAYIPSALSGLPKGNLPVVEDGFIISDPHYADKGGETGKWLINGAVYVGKSVIKWIADNGVNLDQIFVVVAICGGFIIMAGFKKLGTKLTSGSIVGYIACKVVSEACR